MNGILLAAVIVILSNLVLLVLGYLIKVKKQMNLIAGYSPKRVRDKEGLANWVGSGAMSIAALGILTGILFLLFSSYILALVAGYFLISVITSTVMVMGCHRYRK